MGRKSREKQDRRETERVGAIERAAAAKRGAEEGRRRGCLVCRRSDGGFTSVEHIFPESLGNTEEVLPIGVVCDRCNHEACAPLDAALVDFGPISMRRTMYGIASKSGKPPVFKFDNGSLESPKPGHVLLDLDSAKWSKDLPAEPGHKKFEFTAMRHDMTPKRVSKVHRALVKIALEYAWIDFGEERALSSEFDRERDVILNGKHHGFVVIAKTGEPEDNTLRFQLMDRRRKSDDHPVLFIAASFYGVTLATDTLFPEPQGDVPDDEAIVFTF